MKKHLKLLTAIVGLCGAFDWAWAADSIKPGEVWPDNRGRHIQAHGGGIIKVGDTFFWFGEDRSRENPHGVKCVSCYSSTNLVDWTFRNQVLRLSDPEKFGDHWVLERPKVFHNAKTKKYVMYMHVDGPMPGSKKKTNYQQARVGVAVSDTVDGDYHYLKSFRPLGHESRDIGQFVDDDGTGYLISEDSPNGFHIYQLSDDYLSVAKDVHLFTNHFEGGALVLYDGLYYMIGSHKTGWKPNPNVYATAKSLSGPWSPFKNIAPPEKNTYDSQSTALLKISGTQTNTVIFIGDMWNPQALWDSRYFWMPLEIGGGNLTLPQPVKWTLDVVTGETRVQDKH